MPEAHLTWVVEAREYAILRDHPDLDAVVPVDTRRWRRLIWRPAGAREVLGKVGTAPHAHPPRRLRRGHRSPGPHQERAAHRLHGSAGEDRLQRRPLSRAPQRALHQPARAPARLRAPRRRAILGSPRAARRRARRPGVRRSRARGGRAANGRAAPQGRRQAAAIGSSPSTQARAGRRSAGRWGIFTPSPSGSPRKGGRGSSCCGAPTNRTWPVRSPSACPERARCSLRPPISASSPRCSGAAGS